MNTLVALTDFTPAADNAALYAAHLAQSLDAELVLLHVYQLPISMNDMPILAVSAEELKNNSDNGLLRTREELLRQVPGLPVRTESRLGDVNDEINQYCKEVLVIALVMGTHHYTGLEKILFGNTAISVIRHCHYPVITVPESFQGTGVHRIVFATDLSPLEIGVIEKIRSIVKQLRAELHIVHVMTEEEELPEDHLLEPFRDLNPHFRTVHNDDVTEGLQEYIRRTHCDLLIALPHKHNLLDAFLFKLHTKEFVENVDRPLLFIHETPNP
jgi:nucleotide-binding universal stress UspA family protein